MDRDLLTTREVAKVLGVGTTSVKRWADSGLLRCVKTPGGHRRFLRDSVEAFRGVERTRDNDLGAHDDMSWPQVYHPGMGGREIAREIRRDFRRRGSWFAVADALTAVLEDIGTAWERGEISVVQERLISQRLARALTCLCEEFRIPENARSCMLLVAEEDEHTLGLCLLELCLRGAGWNTIWIGSKAPVQSACDYIVANEIDMVAVSASAYSQDVVALAYQADILGQVCAQRRIPLLLGGRGQWPESPRYGHRLRSFAQLGAFLLQWNR